MPHNTKQPRPDNEVVQANIAADFKTLVEDYIERRFGVGTKREAV